GTAREEEVDEWSEQRQVRAGLLHPEELTRRIDFQEHMLPLGRDDEVEAAEDDAEASHQLQAGALDLLRKAVGLDADLPHAGPPVDPGRLRLLREETRRDHVLAQDRHPQLVSFLDLLLE